VAGDNPVWQCAECNVLIYKAEYDVGHDQSPHGLPRGDGHG
jgi:hypothetical protein